MSEKVTIKIEFDNPEAAHHFASWLCESGEQQYWNWMEVREGEENGPITAKSFNYWNAKTVDGEEVYGDFLEDMTIRTECGRMYYDDWDE